MDVGVVVIDVRRSLNLDRLLIMFHVCFGKLYSLRGMRLMIMVVTLDCGLQNVNSQNRLISVMHSIDIAFPLHSHFNEVLPLIDDCHYLPLICSSKYCSHLSIKTVLSFPPPNILLHPA